MESLDMAAFSRTEQGAEGRTLSNEEFEPIYARYGKRVYGYFFCRTGNAQTAEDLTADLFLKVLCRHQSFDAEKAPFEVWLFRLARNMAVDFFRVHKRRADRTVSIEAVREAAGGVSPELRVMEDEVGEALRQAVARLPEKQRSLVALRYAAGMRNTEIAEITGLSESHVGVLMHRALEKLRKILIKQEVDFS